MKIIACLLLLLILLIPSSLTNTKRNSTDSLNNTFRQVSLITGVDYHLLKAIAIVESNLDQWAIGDYGRSLGVMQIHSTTQKHYGIPHHSLMFSPEVNILVGATHLKRLIHKYGVNKAIHVYNTGEKGYRRGLRVREYHRKVVKELNQLRMSVKSR